MHDAGNEAEQLARMLKAIPDGLTLEQRERLSQSVRDLLESANLKELCLARASLTDWLIHYAEWIATHSEQARNHQAVQGVLIRGKLIQEAIAHYRQPSAFAVWFWGHERVAERGIDRLCGFGADWKKRAMAKPIGLPPD